MEKDPIFYHARNRDVLEFTAIVPTGKKYRKLDFGYKQINKNTPSKVYFFLETDFNLSPSEKKFLLHPERKISAAEYEKNLKHAFDLFLSEIGIDE